MVLSSSGIGRRGKMLWKMVGLSAEGDASQANANCFTRPHYAGSMHTIQMAVQELNAVTPTAYQISPPDLSFPMLNHRNKYLHNVLAQVKNAEKRKNDLFPFCLLMRTFLFKHFFKN